MKASALKRNSLLYFAALLAAAIPMFFTACGGGMIAPASGSRQSSKLEVKSVVPNSGPRKGGATVLINGSNFSPLNQNIPPTVTFGGVAASHVTIVSSSQVKVTVPAHATGTVSVEVTTADGESSTLPNGFTYTSGSVTVSGVSPNSGPTGGGTAVTVNGSNFASGAAVSFGGSAASGVSFVSSTQLKATTPAHAAGAVTVQVTNPDGTSASLPNGFTYGSTTLSVSSVSPISGPADGGTAITISGSNFQSGVSVTFGGIGATSVTVTNSSTIQATTPAHSSGPVTVTVTNTDGQSATLPSGFTFHSMDLAWSAPASTPVTITGYNVYRALSSGGPFGKLNGSTPITNTSYSDGTVQGSTTYFYEVKSVDSSGTESTPEGPVQATTSP